MGNGFVVWVKDFAGRSHVQWWAELFYGTHNQWRPLVVVSRPVDQRDVGLTLGALAILYPLEESRG